MHTASSQLSQINNMVRTPYLYNLKNPPGQIVNPIHQGKTLTQEIEEFKNKDKMNVHKQQYRKLVEESLKLEKNNAI